MATVEGNAIALRDVLHEMLPAQPRGLVQSAISGDTFYSKHFAASVTGWQRIDVHGYGIAVLAGEGQRGPVVNPGYLRFATQNGAGPTNIEGAVPVFPGAYFALPQGCQGFWFLPGAGAEWRIVITQKPHVTADCGTVQPGDVVARYDSLNVAAIAGGDSVVVVDSKDLPTGIPLYLRVYMTAGGPTSPTDFPLELRLVDMADGSSDMPHIFPFPGNGWARLALSPTLRRQYVTGTTSQWQLTVSNPTGGASKEYLIVVEVVAGDLAADTWDYRCQATQEGLGDANTHMSFCHPGSPPGGGEGLAYVVNNAAGGQILRMVVAAYIPPTGTTAAKRIDTQTIDIAVSGTIAGVVERHPCIQLVTLTHVSTPTAGEINCQFRAL